MTDAPAATTTRTTGIRAFLATEAASGTILVILAVVALLWANGPVADEYEALFATELGPLDLHEWVNDGLMTLFFLVVGLEIKRELTIGELQDRRAAALPALAALGGMLVPVLLFLAIAGDGTRRGWGAPMATDIAFALGVIALLGDRVPSGARLFLLALAIVDDLGAIAVIAVFYASEVDLRWLAAAVVAVAAVAALRGRWWAVATLGPVAWWSTHESGVHATIAGVALGLVIPVARGERYEHRIHPLTSFVVVPLFALVNAGVAFSGAFDAPGAGRLAVALAVGLVVGKVVGVAGATWLGLRLGLGVLPEGMRASHVLGIAATAGIGFTVSLFVVDLAYVRTPELAAGAKIGILAASVVAAALGLILLARAARRSPDSPDRPEAAGMQRSVHIPGTGS